MYEAMGFKAVDESAEEAAREAVPIPTMAAEMQKDMGESVVPVDDNVPEEPMFQWDKDNPDLFVGVCYPSVGAEYDQLVNICSFAICYDQRWPSTQ